MTVVQKRFRIIIPTVEMTVRMQCMIMQLCNVAWQQLA